MNHQFQHDPQLLIGFHCAPEQLEALEDGELSAGEKRRVLSHLSSCARCRQARRDQALALRNTRAALSEHPRIAAPQDFDARIWESIAARQNVRHTLLSRLGVFLLRPVPRLFSSAMFGLLAALAFGRLAVPHFESSSAPDVLVLPTSVASSDVTDGTDAYLYAMEMRRARSPLSQEPQVLAPPLSAAPQTSAMPLAPPMPQNSTERRPQENPSWSNRPRRSRAAFSLDAGSLC